MGFLADNPLNGSGDWRSPSQWAELAKAIGVTPFLLLIFVGVCLLLGWMLIRLRGPTNRDQTKILLTMYHQSVARDCRMRSILRNFAAIAGEFAKDNPKVNVSGRIDSIQDTLDERHPTPPELEMNEEDDK